jgi:hypothetical protein
VIVAQAQTARRARSAARMNAMPLLDDRAALEVSLADLSRRQNRLHELFRDLRRDR